MSIKPDYVLIDSRTGHTDVGGICTRQLPDSVVVLFFPNAQNLRGLRKIVEDIKSEPSRAKDDQIDIQFVMSNVPELDDEDGILAASIASFQKTLKFTEFDVIHRYASLALLNQVIFTKDRPNSRLTKEYQAITKALMWLNPEDRDGALRFINEINSIPPFEEPAGILDPKSAKTISHMDTIKKHHRTDGEVLYRLGSYYVGIGRSSDGEDLFNQAIEAGYRKPGVFLERAMLRSLDVDGREGAEDDFARVVACDTALNIQKTQAIDMLSSKRLAMIANSPTMAALTPTERLQIANRLDESQRQIETAVRILKSLSADLGLSAEERRSASIKLALGMIALRRFSDAIIILESEVSNVSEMPINTAFNYAMALWGKIGRISREPFERVVELETLEPKYSPDANFLQCLAVAHWAVGQVEMARKFAERSRNEIRQRRRWFSCWQYLTVKANEFEQDIDRILQLINGDDRIRPRFHSVSLPESHS